MKKKIEQQEYEVIIKATLVVRVKAHNAFMSIPAAEAELQEQLAGANIDIQEHKTISASSVEE